MKRIGLLGGISAASTRKYYEQVLDKYYRLRGDYYYPELIINSLNFQYFTDLENQGRRGEYIDYIASGIRALQRAGAEFVAMTANSPHSVLPQVRERVEVPVLSIVDAVGDAIADAGLGRVLLTGIRYTMEDGFYSHGLEGRGISVVVPDRPDRERINAIIFEELVLDRIRGETRAEFVSILDRYEVEGVILGCTELPLLLGPEQYHRPLFDTLDLHCAAILDRAME